MSPRCTHLHAAVALALMVSAGSVSGAVTADSLLLKMKERDRSIQKIVKSKTGGETPSEREALKALVGSFFDFIEFSRLSLGREWGDRTDEERAEFTDLCKRLIERNYADPKLYTKSDSIKYVSASVEGSTALVKTVVHYKNEKSAIDYMLRQVDGEWLIYDMVIDDFPISRNNRSQFLKEIRKSSFQGLVQKLKEKLAEDEG